MHMGTVIVGLQEEDLAHRQAHMLRALTHEHRFAWHGSLLQEPQGATIRETKHMQTWCERLHIDGPALCR